MAGHQYVYAVIEPAVRPPGKPGIAGKRVCKVRAAGLAALVSELPDGEPELGRDELLIHASVLEAALAGGTVLPMQFGTVMQDVNAVRSRLLDQHSAELRAALARLKGKVELRVRAIYEQDSLLRQVAQSDREIAHLRRRIRRGTPGTTLKEQIALGELLGRAIEQRCALDAHELVEALSPFAAEVDVSRTAQSKMALSASFLVERPRVSEFDVALERLARERADRMRLKYTGPLPPHSFIGSVIEA